MHHPQPPAETPLLADELDAAWSALADVDELKIEPLAKRVFQLANPEGTRVSYDDVGRVTGFVIETRMLLQSIVKTIDMIDASIRDLVEDAHDGHGSVPRIGANGRPNYSDWQELLAGDHGFERRSSC